MPIVENEVIINAPVQDIYDYVSKPNNLPQIWPSLLKSHTRRYYPMAVIATGGNIKCRVCV